MLSIETRVNGTLINYTYVHNEGQISNGDYLYSVEHHRFNREPQVINFKIKHKREELAEKLILKVYQEINKILIKRNKK